MHYSVKNSSTESIAMDTVERSAIANEKDLRTRDDDVETGRERKLEAATTGKFPRDVVHSLPGPATDLERSRAR
jgi:hypothetical protein